MHSKYALPHCLSALSSVTCSYDYSCATTTCMYENSLIVCNHSCDHELLCTG